MKEITAIVIDGKEHEYTGQIGNIDHNTIIEAMGWETRKYYECEQCNKRSQSAPTDRQYLIASLTNDGDRDARESRTVCSKACVVAALERMP